jgi:hypothetical protein
MLCLLPPAGGNNDGPSAPAPWDGGANDPPLDVPGQGRRRRRAAAGGAAGEGPSEGLQGGLQGQEQEGGGQGDSGKGYHQVSQLAGFGVDRVW